MSLSTCARWTSLVCAFGGGAVLLAGRAAAQNVDLGALGLNWNFELPAQAHSNTAENTSQSNIGPGWTFKRISGASTGDNYGVADPIGEGATPHYCCFSAPAPDGVLPAPFEGRQIGFMNLTDTDGVAQIASLPIGSLQAGQTYSLTVALGARATDAWADVEYAIGLATSVSGVDLGTFATLRMNPTAAAQTNIADLTYTLNVNAQAAAFVGQDASIVIRAANGFTGGPSPPDFVQANFDNVRLSGTFGVPANNAPALTINRDTGVITLSKTGLTNYNIIGYQLTSAAGSFNQANWTKISVAYDKSSAGKLVDVDNDWTVLSKANDSTDLAEAELEIGGNGGVLATGTPVSFGNAWRKTPYQDVVAKLMLANGIELTVPVTYTGTAITAGNLNGDTAINAADWQLFKSGNGANFTGLTKAEAYALGDLNGDGKHNLADFSAFRTAYNAANGPGALESLMAVPEPAAFALVLTGIGLATARRGRRRSPWRVRLAACAALVVAISGSARQAAAQQVIAHWSFDTPTITTDATGILSAADATGNHHATTVRAGTPQINSVAGQFGQAAQFTNTNANGVANAANNAWFSFPQLTEIAGPTAGDFSVAAWVNVPDQASWDSNTILADWGNSATNTRRFTYWFSLANVDGNAGLRPRAQLRAANAPPDPATIDILATTLTAAQASAPNPPNTGPTTFDDGTWHHLAWVWTKAAGQMQFYTDGVLRHTQTSTQTGDNLNLLVSDSLIGALGAKRDNNRYFVGSMDEVWVVGGALTAEQVLNLQQFNAFSPSVLTLRIDQANGQMEIRNNVADPIALSSYEITSDSGGLDPANWKRIANQYYAGFAPGTGIGDGWEATPNPSTKAITEWYLQGTSTLNQGQSVKIGSAYNEATDPTDLVFKYTTANGSVITGVIEYGSVTAPANPADFNNDGFVNKADLDILRNNFGAPRTKVTGDADGDGDTDGRDFLIWQRNNGATQATAAAGAVPEPATGLLVAAGAVALVAVRSRRRSRGGVAPAAIGAAAIAAAALTGASASATVTIDRNYRFGDDAGELGQAGYGQFVGNNTAGNATFDSAGTPGTGTLHDLGNPFGSFGGPVYANVSSSVGGLARPGAAANERGATFDGLDDYLFGAKLGLPSTTASSVNGSSGGTLNYTGLNNFGFQLWVRPNAAGTGIAQTIVADGEQLGLRIDASNTWGFRYNGVNVASAKPVTFNAWTHVMVVRPRGSAAPEGGAILYINGEAVAGAAGNYNINEAATVPLYVGVNQSLLEPFNGTLDDLTMFVMGKTVNGIDRGTFNLGTDNGFLNRPFAQGGLTGKAGDVNQDNAITTADVAAFVAGWGSAPKTVGGVRAGDKLTLASGDLNFDGVTNLADAAILNAALHAAGLPALDLATLPVPEPTTATLTLALAALGMCRAGRRCATAH